MQILFTFLAFAVLALGELTLSICGIAIRGFQDFPIRNMFEIAALLTMSYACNYDRNRLNNRHLRNISAYYILTLCLAAGIFFLFREELSKVILYGIEVLLFSKYLINASEKVDASFQRWELIVLGASLLFFMMDLFLRLWDGYVSILITASVTGFSIVFLSYLIREHKTKTEKAISMRDREIEIFADITKKLNSNFKLKALLDNFVEEICKILDAYSAALYIDKTLVTGRSNTQLSGELICEAIQGFYPPVAAVNERAVTKLEFLHKAVQSYTVKSGEGVIGRVYNSGQAELLKDLDRDPGFIQTIPQVAITKTILTMPLMRQGVVYGTLQLVNKNDGENFTQDNFQFAEMITDQASLAIYNTFLLQERERKLETDADLKAAQDIQLSLIPRELPPSDYLDIAKYFSPTKQIGGDYYDFIRIDDKHLGIIVADVSGKGVTGGLVMSVMRTIMRMVAPNNYSPMHVLKELNQGVSIAVKEKHMFITVMYCIFSEETKTVKVCRAGHNPLLHCKGSTGEILLYKPEGIALGIIDSGTFARLTKEIEVPYQSGDSFFLYTDGVVEEFDANKRMFGDDRLRKHLSAFAGKPSEDVVRTLIEDLTQFRGEDRDQHDDIAVINIRAL